jgi:hypothetical protein
MATNTRHIATRRNVLQSTKQKGKKPPAFLLKASTSTECENSNEESPIQAEMEVSCFPDFICNFELNTKFLKRRNSKTYKELSINKKAIYD